MSSDKNSGNVAGGLKATLKNPRVSDEAKDNAQERLDQLESGAPVSEVQSQTSKGSDKNEGNVIGGYKATLKNPNTSREAKEHARQVINTGVETADDDEYIE